MTALVIAFTSTANSQTPTFDTDLYLPVAGNIAYLTIGRDPTFGFYDQLVTHPLTQPEINGLGFDWAITTIYNGVNYFRVTFNGEYSNTLTDTISGSINGPLYGDTHDGKEKPHPPKKEHEASSTGSEVSSPLQPEPQLKPLPESLKKLLKAKAEKPKPQAKQSDYFADNHRKLAVKRRAEDDEIAFIMGLF